MAKRKASDQDALLELSRREPKVFRAMLEIDGAGSERVRYANVIAPFQERDFAALDPIFMWTAGSPGAEDPAKKKAWIQRARGHSKTTDIASELTWLCYAGRKQASVIVGAADRDQAKLVSSSIRKLIEMNPWLSDFVDHTTYEIRSKNGNVVIEILPADAASSFGYTPHLTICDEFTHWRKAEFWGSLVSSAEKKRGCLVVCCNAGVGKDWKFNVREAARTDPQWYYSAPEGCVAPWFTQKQLDGQRKLLPPAEYSRLWENKWQESGGELVSLEEALACVNHDITEQDYGTPGWSYVASVDYAEKHDFTVGGIGHVYDHKIYLDRMDVEMPRPGKSVKTSWVRNWMENIQERFLDVLFIVDPYQLVTIIEELGAQGFDIERFDFGSGKGNYEIGIALRQAIIHNRVEWYPNCGAVQREWGREGLEDELASLIVKPTSGGKRWRFDHINDNVHHDDRSYVLGSMIHACVRQFPEGGEYFGMSDWQGLLED